MMDYYNKNKLKAAGEEHICIQFFSDFYPNYETYCQLWHVGKTRRFACENNLIGKSIEEITILYKLQQED